MSAAPFSLTESRIIPASATTIYALISDIPQMSRYSPETVQTAWLDGATTARVGARFTGTNAIGSMRWKTKPVVTAADPGQRLSFRVPSGAISTWTYSLEPVDGGTQVIETMHTERPMPAVIRALTRLAGVRDRAEHLRAGMATTLARLCEAAVAAESSLTAR